MDQIEWMCSMLRENQKRKKKAKTKQTCGPVELKVMKIIEYVINSYQVFKFYDSVIFIIHLTLQQISSDYLHCVSIVPGHLEYSK